MSVLMLWIERLALKILVLLFVLLVLLQITGCAPHEELRSPCHVASSQVAPDCNFTPINEGLS